jgi:hypothetical protein
MSKSSRLFLRDFGFVFFQQTPRRLFIPHRVEGDATL